MKFKKKNCWKVENIFRKFYIYVKGMIYLRKNYEIVRSEMLEVFLNWRRNFGIACVVSRVRGTDDSLKIFRLSSTYILFNSKYNIKLTKLPAGSTVMAYCSHIGIIALCEKVFLKNLSSVKFPISYEKVRGHLCLSPSRVVLGAPKITCRVWLCTWSLFRFKM